MVGTDTGPGRESRTSSIFSGRAVGRPSTPPPQAAASSGRRSLADPYMDPRYLGELDHPGQEVYELQGRSDRTPTTGLDVDAAVDEDDGSSLADGDRDDVDEDGPNRHLDLDGVTLTGRSRRASLSSAASFQLYTPDEEQAVVRKFDRRLVVFVALLYMLSFLDRSNIANARIAGMDDDLQSASRNEEWYEWALTAFYIAYISFEWMALLWRLIPAHIYVSMLVLSWGLAASLQAITTNYPTLIFLRVLLGIGEAGFAGIPLYLSFFFKRSELAFRTAIFISAAPLATSFASSLAWLITKLGASGPIAPWRLLFLIEGFPSVFVSVIAWNIIPDSPETAVYLTPRERRVARLRLRHEEPRPHHKGPSPSSFRSGGLKAREVLAVLTDPVAWLTSAIFFLANMAYASLPAFLPKILADMGHTALASQALAAPPYLAAFAAVLATARASDRRRARGAPLAAHALLAAAGYALLALGRPALGLGAGSPLRYLALFPAAIGFFNVVVLAVVWALNNHGAGAAGAPFGFAMLQLVGQCGPLVGTRLYPERDAPFYEPGMAACAAAMLAVALLALLLRWHLRRANARLDAEQGGRGDGGRPGEAEAIVGREEEEEERLVPGSTSSAVGDARTRRRTGFRYML